MRTMLKKAIRDESGKILILVLVLLVVGGLLLGPLLGLMSTGLASGQVYEKKASELYAADAGVEAAVWGIQTKNLIFNDDRVSLDPVTVNGKTVRVEIEREDLGVTQCRTLRQYRYYILSEAFDDGGATTVNAVLSVFSNLPPDFSGLLDYAIAGNGTISLTGGGDAASEVHGDVYIWDREGFIGDENCIEEPHELYDRHQRTVDWPGFDDLSSYYLAQVDVLNPYPHAGIDIKHVKTAGAMYRDDGFSINNSGPIATLELTGTVYIKGDLKFEQSGRNSGYTVDLKGHTIFVDGTIDVSPQFITITGSGCIIARGDITLLPVISNTEGGYVLLLSVEGDVRYRPQAPTPWNQEPEFYGTIAGKEGVFLNPMQRVHWTTWQDKNLNFPMGNGEGGEQDVDKLPISDLRIDSWEIQQGGQ